VGLKSSECVDVLMIPKADFGKHRHALLTFAMVFKLYTTLYNVYLGVEPHGTT
jgi:hypothetical protein